MNEKIKKLIISVVVAVVLIGGIMGVMTVLDMLSVKQFQSNLLKLGELALIVVAVAGVIIGLLQSNKK